MSAAAPLFASRGGRRVVLKRLDNDCLLDGQLHPSIRLRLQRVRELPVKCVANFLGVERDSGSAAAQLVWEYVPGTPLTDVQSADWLKLSREVVLAVQSLHAAGIVHGAIHGGNVIVDDATGEVRLTHVSPLLYSDPDHDAADVAAMLAALVNERELDSTLARVLSESAAEPALTLEGLYARLGTVNVEPPAETPAAATSDSRRRLRAVVAAGLIGLIGAVTSLAVYWRVMASESPPYTPRSVRTE